MKIETLHVGMQVRHPQYGVGTVRSIGEHTAEIRFNEGVKTIAPETADLSAAEPQAALSSLSLPLQQLIEQTAQQVIEQLGLERPDTVVEELAGRWRAGRLVLHPADSTLQTKEVPIELLFHKIIGIRNQLRLIEQKLNANDKLSDAEKVDLQQYITRCYGSMTTFNLLFKDKAGQFTGTSAG